MKLFLFGIVVGALACFGVIRFVDRQVPPDAAPERPISAAAPERPIAAVAPERPIAAAGPAPASAADTGAVKSAAVGLPSVEPPPAVANAPSNWIENLTEREASELCTYANRLQQAREQAVKDAEPKDAGWAYSMEQLMRQHIEMHVPADQYTKVKIECRTTFCELRMEGKKADSRELADTILQQIQFQDWSDIVQQEAGTGSSEEGWHLDYNWLRLRTETDRRRWLWYRDRMRQQQQQQQQQ
jgi:hypothetical protein